jgi:hypothetical protein
MARRPGHVVVTTEVAVCSFCGRPRTLRREAHQLGGLVRTVVTCETCHRTLSSTIAAGTAEPETVAASPEPAAEAAPEPAPEPEAVTQPAARKRAAKASTTRAKTTRKPAAKAPATKSKTSEKN